MNITALIIGISFSLLGLALYFYPTKKPNAIYGYRTESAMKNENSWKIAQNYSSKWLLIIGVVSTVLATLPFFISVSETTLDKIVMGWTLLGLVLTVLFTERKLKNTTLK